MSGYVFLLIASLCLICIVINPSLFANFLLSIIGGVIATFIYASLPTLKRRMAEFAITTRSWVVEFKSDFGKFMAPVFMSFHQEQHKYRKRYWRLVLLRIEYVVYIPISMIGISFLLVKDRISKVWNRIWNN